MGQKAEPEAEEDGGEEDEDVEGGLGVGPTAAADSAASDWLRGPYRLA